ncbi:coadhesin [Patella vulgata]|uniref:coadhesin n=1 Tax=Patella vulgata TaxID=6465 RepID=UPI00217F7959|nr:coadhesin [Patella vulgata]
MRFILAATLVLVIIITVVDAGRRHRVRNGIRLRYSYGRQLSMWRRYHQRRTLKQISCDQIRRSQICSRCFAVDGNWGTWSEFSTCCSVCGVVEQKRSRVCDNPPPEFGGADCPGDPGETKSCNSNACLDNVTRPICANQSFEVMVLVDSSANITVEAFGQERDLLQNLYTELSIDGDARRFGFIAHGGASPIIDSQSLFLRETNNIAAHQARINDLEKIGGLPFLDVAINALLNVFEISERFRLPDIRRIGILITAAGETPINETTILANDAKAQNITMYAIGISDRVSEEFVQAIASDPSGAINTGYSLLNETATRLKQLICFCDK